MKYGNDASLVVRDGLHTGRNVTFTSLNDDTVAGQSQAVVGTPNPGDWRGLQILPTASAAGITINGLQIKYAGSSGNAALEIAQNTYVLDALLIADSLLGIRALNATASQFTHLSLIGNHVGMEASQNAVPQISNSEISGNTQLGILNLTPQTIVLAQQNWWGDASGPKDPVGNPSGIGDAVSTGVNYGQSLTAAPLLSCSIDVASGNYTITQASVSLILSCRNAVSYRLSESANFGSTPYSTMAATATYTFTGGPRSFMLYAQYQSASGATVTVNLPASIVYAPLTSNLTLSKGGPTSVAVAGMAVYTLTLGNNGTGISGTAVTVADTLPTGMTYVSAAAGNNVSAVNCSGTASLTCSITLAAALPAGASNAAVFTITVKAPNSAGSITNYASVDGSGGASPPTPGAGCTPSTSCASAATNVISAAAPIVTITSPSNGAQVSTSAQIAATVASSLSIASVDIAIDGSKTTTITSPPYQWTWPLAGVALGSHTITVTATDSIGQTGQTSITVQVVSADITGPTVQNITFNSSALASGATLTSAAGVLAAQVSDPSGVASVAVALDGQNLSGGALSGTQFSIPISFTQANGPHTLVLTAADTVGNVTTVTLNITLNIGPPAAPVITSPSAGALFAQSNVPVSGTADYGSKVQLYVDGTASGTPIAVTNAGAFSGTATLPAQGAHQLTATASSSYGTSPASAPVNVTYTLPPATIVITSPSNNATLTADTDISVAVVDTQAITQVVFQIDGTSVATLTSTPYTWLWALSTTTAGSHTIAVNATDAAGNVLQASVPVTVQITPPPPPPVVTPYTGSVQSISPTTSYGEQPITIAGQAVDRTSGNPVPNALLTLVLQVNGFKRQINLTTDATGSFSYAFQPYSTDAGTYVVSVIHPQETTLPALGQFTINRLNVSPSIYNLQAARTVATTIPVQVQASSGSGVSGVYLSADAGAQPSGSVPGNITVTAPPPVNLAAGATTTINVQFVSDNTGGDTGTVVLVAHASDSGSASRGSVAINYSLSSPTPALYPQPSYLQLGVAQGNQVIGTIQLQNKGSLAATNVTAQLRNNDGSLNVPSWVNLASTILSPSLDIGATQTIQLNAAPTSAVTDGIYNFKIHVAADNAIGGDIPVSISVTQSGVGNVVFNASDIYTNTLDKNGNPIPGLAGATIQIQNQRVYTVVQSATTGANGNAEIDNLPAGYYTFVANAPNHKSASGVLTILPGVTGTQSVFLDYNLVSVQWSVTETDITDEYQVTLNTTYQTQVPAPVVLMEPATVNLPALQLGEVFTGELVITNYGLVRADNVVFTPPSNDTYYKYEFMGTVPASLEAHQRISLPYKVTGVSALPASSMSSLAIKALHFDASSGSFGAAALKLIDKAATSSTTASTSSGFCYNYNDVATLTYGYRCANGTDSTGSATTTFVRVYGQCTSGGGGISIGGGGGGGGGGFGGGGGGIGTPLGSSPGCTPECQTCPCKKGAQNAGS